MNDAQARSQTLSRRRALRGVAIGSAGLGAAALIGCSAGGRAKATPTATVSGAASGAPRTPEVSESFVLLQTRDAPSLDALDSSVATVPERIGLVYPRLVNYTRDAAADQADTKQIASYAVDGWEVAKDGLQVTFKLRKGVKYPGVAPLNGRPLDAADVKYSLTRYMTDAKSVFQAKYADLASIETPDPSTVVFKMKKPSRYFMYALAAEPSFVTPKEIETDFRTKAIGPGPFVIDSVTQGEGVQLHKNPDHIDAAKIYYRKYQIKVITDAAARAAAIVGGQADVWDSGGLSKAEMKGITAPTVKAFQNPLIVNNGLWFNMNNPKFADIRTRMAISKAFDRQTLLDQAYQSDGAFGGPLPIGFGKWALSDKELREANAYRYDPAEAKKLWDAAGKPMTAAQLYTVPKNILPALTNMAEIIQQSLQTNLGLKSDITSEDYSAFLPKGYGNKFPDMCVFAYLFGDALEQLLAAYYPGGSRNGPGLNDAKVSGMLDDLRATLDDAAAVQKSRDFGKYVTENVLSMSHLPANYVSSIYNAKLQNFLPGVYPYGVEWTLWSWKSK